MCKLRVWWLYYIGTSHTSRSPYYEKFCTTKVTILWLYIVQNVKLRVWWLYYIDTSHTSRSPYYEKFCTTKVTILWLYIVQNVKLRVWWLYYIDTSHTSRSPYYEKFCTTKVTILWLYIVQNVQVASMVTVLYRHKSHIAITILWKILYYQGHHTVTLHSTKCASCEYGDCTI